MILPKSLGMMRMVDPAQKARWVLQTKAIGNIPAAMLTAIADSEGIGYKMKSYVGDWDGVLAFQGDKRAILVNTRIGSTGRHNFTFAHELGHYFLNHPPSFYENGESGIRCTAADVEDAQKPREVQANRFAVELLMPEEQFRLDMAGAPIDFALITGLSNRYMVSKHACSNRIVTLTQIPCVIIFSKDGKVTTSTVSQAARGVLKRLESIPQETSAYNAIQKTWGHDDFISCDASKWFLHDIPTKRLYECTHCHQASGTALTILKW